MKECVLNVGFCIDLYVTFRLNMIVGLDCANVFLIRPKFWHTTS